MDLSKVKDRDALRAQREPHWHRLSPGRYLGYRPSAREGTGTWIARVYDQNNRSYRFQALGDFAGAQSRDRFAMAKAEAEKWASLIERGGSAKLETVADACKAYGKINAEAVDRFKRHVDDDPIAKVSLQKLATHDVKAWRKRLEDKPAQTAKQKDGTIKTRPRAPATINRDMSMLRAALNLALEDGHIASSTAWLKPLRAIESASRRRTLYLDRKQRRALLLAINGESEPFARGLCLLPLRPGALAALKVGDFDKRTGAIMIASDKEGGNRSIKVPKNVITLLNAQSKSKLPSALLFSRAGGEAWTRHTWKRPIRDAAIEAGLPAETSAYTLRHSVITDLVQNGLDLLSIAQMSGTSVAMIEAHYGHFRGDRAALALAELAL